MLVVLKELWLGNKVAARLAATIQESQLPRCSNKTCCKAVAGDWIAVQGSGGHEADLMMPLPFSSSSMRLHRLSTVSPARHSDLKSISTCINTTITVGLTEVQLQRQIPCRVAFLLSQDSTFSGIDDGA